MANVKQTVEYNPGLATLTFAADVYEIELDKYYTPSPANGGKGVIAVKVETGNIRFSVGKDPSGSGAVLDSADGWVEFAFHNGQNNLRAKGSADGATFLYAAR